MSKYKYTQRTLKYLRGCGWECDITERWIPGARIKKDLFGIIDIVGLRSGVILGVQSTSWAQRKPHLKTILETQAKNSAMWLAAGAKLWLISWKKVKIKRGGKAFRYEPVLDEITPTVLERISGGTSLSETCEEDPLPLDPLRCNQGAEKVETALVPQD